MIYADDIIEKNSLFIRNIDKNSTRAKDVWTGGSSSYACYNILYNPAIIKNHVYYYKLTYKFTTTNQSPTWAKIYAQGGSAGTSAGVDNPVAGTEYTFSAIWHYSNTISTFSLTSGNLYNGPATDISGVTAYVKNSVVYDVTQLQTVLLAKGTDVHTDALLKTWCDINLDYVPFGTNYDVSSLVTDNTTKTIMKKGFIVAKQFIEADGMKFYSVSNSLKNDNWFDTSIPFSVYNNSGNGNVTLTRVDAKAQGSPWWYKHPYVCKIITSGTATPGAGGFYAAHTASANKVFIERFIAKIPVGYTVVPAYNSQGDGATITMITSNQGTGNWEEYAVLYRCGSSGSFSSGGHIYLNGTDNTNVTWYVAYINNCDVTGHEELINYSILKPVIKSEYIYDNEFDCCQLLTNGNFDFTESTALPANCTIDSEDYAGNATHSLVQAVNANGCVLPLKIKINPLARYKISYWVKCKGDMTSFLTAIVYYDGNFEYRFGNCQYVNGTMTQLTVALESGATEVKVKSNANWADRTYGKLAFRSGDRIDKHDKGCWPASGVQSTGYISGKSGTDTILLKQAYTGDTMPINTWICQGGESSTYIYPINKTMLPTDNTWKYVEGYFGVADALYDGRDYGWSKIPSYVKEAQIRLNLYNNNGTVPIKYSDIRIEPVSATGVQTRDIVQMKGGI